MTILDIILVVNIILKLTGNINWSWKLTLWPLWASIAILLYLKIKYR